MTWAPYGASVADDQDRLWMWIHHSGASDGWVSTQAIRRAFRVTGTNPSRVLRADLMALQKAGRIERKCENPNDHWAQRRVFYRGIHP